MFGRGIIPALQPGIRAETVARKNGLFETKISEIGDGCFESEVFMD